MPKVNTAVAPAPKKVAKQSKPPLAWRIHSFLNHFFLTATY
jgi:hypothetical protein